MTTTRNRFECACEHGGDCTRITMCKLQSVSTDLENEVEVLEEQLEQVKSWMYLRLSEKGCEHPDACGCGECEGCRFENELTERFDELAAILKVKL